MGIESIDRIDHHGIVAGTIHDLGLIELIDGHLGQFKDEKISAGEAVAGMIINGLGFTDRPLSLAPQFFKTCPLNALFGREIDPEDFNRFKMGRILDRAHKFGCEQLFTLVASKVVKDQGIDNRFGHLDSSSFTLTGEYLPDSDENTVHVTHGYSKDHRPDLKQVILEMMVTQDSSVPTIAKSWDGNSSDNTNFSERCKVLAEGIKDSVWPSYIVADSKLYCTANAPNLNSMAFITRVPNTISEVSKKIDDSIEHTDHWIYFSPERKFQKYSVSHMGINQRWIVVHSQSALERCSKTIDRSVSKERAQIEKDLFHLQAKRFSCEPDARLALEEKSKKWKYHLLTLAKVHEIQKFKKRGRPKSDEEPGYLEFQISGELIENDSHISRLKDRGACYILGTNTSPDELTDEDIIQN